MTLNLCGTGVHRHQLACARCEVVDQTVAVTVTRDGNRWPPLCSGCAARVHRQVKSQLLSALEKAVEAAA